MLTRVYLSTATVSKDMDRLASQVDASAIEHALDIRCSESEESSDDSCSSDDSQSDDEEEYEAPSATLAPRRPSVSLDSPSDRRASVTSQRSPLSINSARSLSNCHYNQPTPSPRTPSMSMRHDAALRSFQQKIDQETQYLVNKSAKPRPAMMNITSISSIPTPRIEIEQVYDDGDEEDLAKKEAEVAKAEDRSAARKRMLTTLSRSQSSPTVAAVPGRRTGSRRVPSLDHISNLYNAKVGVEEIKTPAPKTPGTASPFHHQRNSSCPTPTSPYAQHYGEVQVIITPPTPRPQGPGSPALGVYINGLHGNNGFNHFADNTYLLPPAFELAAGKLKARAERQSEEMAWMATMQAQQQQLEELCRQQQQVLFNSIQQALPSYYDVMTNGAGLGMTASFPSPSIIPGTPGAPSMIHIEQQRAMLAQQQALQGYYLAAALSPPEQVNSMSNLSPPKSSPRLNSAKPTSASTKSWWRGNPDSSKSMIGASSGSLYSKSSGGVSPADSTADSSPAWRRKESEVVGSPEKMKSAVYLPPAKRAALLKQQQSIRT